MQSLIRSKSAGVTGGRGTAGAGPGRDLSYKPSKCAQLSVPKKRAHCCNSFFEPSIFVMPYSIALQRTCFSSNWSGWLGDSSPLSLLDYVPQKNAPLLNTLLNQSNL